MSVRLAWTPHPPTPAEIRFLSRGGGPFLQRFLTWLQCSVLLTRFSASQVSRAQAELGGRGGEGPGCLARRSLPQIRSLYVEVT